LPPIYTRAKMAQLNAELPELLNLLHPRETTKDLREWHETSRYLYDICLNPNILDLVEGILGPNFFMWASNFFIKEPFSTATVGWHQDAYYWPMTPQHSVTVWLAFDDVDEENGAMQIIPKSHRRGPHPAQAFQSDRLGLDVGIGARQFPGRHGGAIQTQSR